jgi:glycine reductase
VLAAEGAAYIVPTEATVMGMRDALPRMAALARRLAAGEALGPPGQEGYLPRGLRRNEIADHTGAERAVELLLAKLAGDVRTEVTAAFDDVPPPPPVTDMTTATVALVTESGLVPRGNPTGSSQPRPLLVQLPDRRPTGLDAADWETVHGGYDTSVANADPNWVVPLDALRRGRRGPHRGCTRRSTRRPATRPRWRRRPKFGQEIAQRLREAGIQAVILTGT